MVAVVLAAAFLANLAFRRYRIPDVLLLIFMGVLLGPVLGFADIGLFRQIGPLVGTIAILVILFDGGLEIRLADLRGGAAIGAMLAVVVFTATVVLCMAVATIRGMAWDLALLLGLVLGGAGVVIVVPLIRRLGVDGRAATAVTVEAAFADVFVILGVYVAGAAIASGHADGLAIGTGILVALGVGIGVGLAAGLGWARLLGAGWLRGYEYVLTLAALFGTHVVVEASMGSGPIAVLAFGLVVGNSRRSRRFADESTLVARDMRVPVFGESLAGVQQEVVFLVRALVFVGLGVTLDLAAFQSPAVLVTGAVLTLAIAVARMGGAFALLRPYSVWDRTCVGLMFHRGVAAAALSQVPADRFGIPGAEVLVAYAAVVIIMTNVLASLLVALNGALARGRPMHHS